MSRLSLNNRSDRERRGIVLLVTLVLLVVLATLGYTLGSRVAAQRHRNHYIIDYSKARYGCDSAVKYALATLEEIKPELVSRPNEPDFSDLFALDEVEYQELLTQWGLQPQQTALDAGGTSEETASPNDVNDIDLYADELDGFGVLEPVVRGPYGPPWPFVTEPVEFEIGSAKVRIEIEDENAKYPLIWAIMDDKELDRAAQAGFDSFCGWMALGTEKTNSLREQLKQIAEIRPFKTELKPITQTVRAPVQTPTTATKSTTSRTTRARTYRKTVPVSQQQADQTVHFARVFHSSLLDTEALARPTMVSYSREESPLKYIGIWSSQKVNVNTAPRHVLEAAFTFGGDEVEIAEQIIQERRLEPFASTEALRAKLLRYSDSISKSEKFITTVSQFFTIRITSVSGVAKASSIIAITKEGDKVKRIAVING